MEKNVPTIIKSLIQSASLMNRPYTIYPYSTINQKLNILAGETLEIDEIPDLKYVVLGNGGLTIQTSADGFTYPVSYCHKPTDTGLFSEIPFIVRPIGSDISPTVRMNYRLRKLITVGDSNYFAYYGKLLDFGSNTPTLHTRSVQSDGTVSVANFTPDASNLNPTPTLLSSGDTVTTTGDYICASTRLDFVLTASDVLELLNSSVLIYGDENHAIVSEIALCTGVERPETSSSAGGTTVVYTEAAVVQVMNFLSTNFPTPSWNQGVRYTFDIGNSEPILSVA